MCNFFVVFTFEKCCIHLTFATLHFLNLCISPKKLPFFADVANVYMMCQKILGHLIAPSKLHAYHNMTEVSQL